MLDYLLNNIPQISALWIALVTVLSGVFQATGHPSLSKLCGSLFALDVGRMIRQADERRKQRRLARITAVLLACLACLGCHDGKPAKTPSAVNVAATAINLTDRALSVAIADAKVEQLTLYEDYVRWLEQAAEVVRVSGDICPQLPKVELIATALECSECSTIVAAAAKELECKP